MRQDKANDQTIDRLLREFEDQRKAVTDMITELEQLKKNVDGIFPKEFDARFKMHFDEKLKAATEFFKVLLDMRKEITKSLKDEIEIRRKIDSKDKEIDIEDLLDIRKLSSKVEDFKKKKVKLQNKRREDAPVIDDAIDIPGVNSAVR
jgi:hypothetical protein